MKRLAIFASGSGTNAERVIHHFSNVKMAKVCAVYTNNPEAFVIKRAERLNTECIIFDRNDFYRSGKVLHDLRSRDIDFIVLAGFLWKMPPEVTSAWEGRMVNIHPALLPSYGGKGMYGMNVHRAVIASGETRSGITVHYVNDEYDEGSVIFSADCDVLPDDTPESLAARIHELEHRYYPAVIEQLIDRL